MLRYSAAHRRGCRLHRGLACPGQCAGLALYRGPPHRHGTRSGPQRRQAVAKSDGDCSSLAIEALDTGQIVGAVGSHYADPRAGRFEYGITMGAGHRRKGYAAEAVVMLLRFMFAKRRYHKCEARIFGHNEASLALHRRLGFAEEGRLRDHVFFASRHHDLVVMGILVDEFARLHSMSELE
ncbi:GNAT family N-acetyltransferase [Streptomyces sp. NPDC048521]|uniref:GNAT family N-acetyltransferase n=1 Tax=Streptomyces sp. NPDC048521 TaxID=3365566 RepID=UPI00371F4833